jgi:hypothetical protein
VSCTFSRDTLALHVEGDLPLAIADAASRHLERCQECRQFFAQLQVSQSLVKSLRRQTVSPSECTAVRQDVMSILDRRDRLGWALWVERVTTVTFRRHAYAVAACAILVVVSASVLAQIRHAPASRTTSSAAVFEGRDTLLRPAGYRDWILVNEPAELHPAGRDDVRTEPARAHRVYIDPDGYRAYATTGTFAEGTVMIWESERGESGAARHPYSRSPALLVSVKDTSRFDDGWGFFDFVGQQGRVRSKAGPSPESSGCRTCHLEEAATDSVFVQFYSTLRTARQEHPQDEGLRRSTRLTDLVARPRASPHAQPTLAHS